MLVVKYHRIKFTRFLKVEGKIHQIKKLGWNSPKIKKLDIKGYASIIRRKESWGTSVAET